MVVSTVASVMPMAVPAMMGGYGDGSGGIRVKRSLPKRLSGSLKNVAQMHGKRSMSKGKGYGKKRK